MEDKPRNELGPEERDRIEQFEAATMQSRLN